MEKQKTEAPGNSGGSVIQLNSTKAGMEGLDVAAINNIINEASKGSKFYEHKQKQQKEIARKLEEMNAKLASLSETAIVASEKEMDKYGEELESIRNYDRFIVHVDMDAFYAAVEMRDNPDLKEKPMAVGGDKMLSTSNYIARKFGVRAGMPGFMGKKLCPQLVIVPCNFDKYRAVSQQVHNILKDYDPHFSSVSLDEAYLDITNYVSEKETSPEDVVREMRKRIFEDTQLTASAGIASNGFLAKICGDICKPNNQYYLQKNREAEEEFVKSLPIRKINGIGFTMEQLLHGFDVYTAEDIWKKRGIINLVFKPLTSRWLIRVAKGYENASEYGYAESERKSISSETTLEKSTTDIEKMIRILEEISKELETDLETRTMKCKQVAVKIKTDTFEVRTRSSQLLTFTDKAVDIFKAAKNILEAFIRDDKTLCVRLLGIRLAKWNRGHEATEGEAEPPRKQPRIDSFLSKSSSETSRSSSIATAYVCPICNRSFLDENAVTEHVDDCLVSSGGFEGSSQGGKKPSNGVNEQQNKASPSGSNSKSGGPSKANVTLASFFEAINAKKQEKAMNTQDHQSEGIAIKRPAVTSNPESPNNGNSSSSLDFHDDSGYTCPVCNRCILSILEPRALAYSEHVDSCLAGGPEESDLITRRWKFKA